MDTNITIIGAGVVGLAISTVLSSKYSNLVVLEKNEKFGQETSSRNSEVIHSGIYYPTNSLKAKLCVEGKKLLINYCKDKDVNFRLCGKLMIAQNQNEIGDLQKVHRQSQINGVTDGELLNQYKIKELEPNIIAEAGIFYPTTGIIDSFGLMKQFVADSSNNGAHIVYKSEVVGLKKIFSGYEVTVKDTTGIFSFTTKVVINASGLWADCVSNFINIYDPNYTIHFWKGEYFSVGNGKNKFVNHLIYPVPMKNHTGLGVHATLDLNNNLKLGPNAIYLDDKKISYSVNPSHRNAFYSSVKTFLPFINETDLRPDQAGVRPKLQKPNSPVRDFIICNEKQRGFNNFINLIGIESPGLTSCLAIANYVSSLIELN